MRKRIRNILKGEYLVSGNAAKNWMFILFCVLLAIVMIGSSHSAEQKVHQIAEKQDETQRLRSEFVDQRQRLMQLKMESNITEELEERGLIISTKPPQKIVVE